MKKVTILFSMILIASVAFMSFKKAELGTWYGGTASVKIDIIQVTTNNGERKIISSPTLNASTSCTSSNSAAAKRHLELDLEHQANSKTTLVSYKPGVTNEWEYAGEINYKITTCN